MSILLKWKKRLLLESPAGFLFTVSSVVITVALLTAVLLLYREIHLSSGTDNDGMLRYLVPFLCAVLLLCSGVNLYITFTAALEGSRNQYGLLSGAGATKRQFLQNQMAEAAMIDLIGAVIGCPLGWRIAHVLFRQYNTAQLGAVSGKPYLAFVFALPELLLVPAVCLVVSGHRLARSKQENRPKRTKEEKNRRMYAVVKKVFGAGGELEWRIARHDRRFRNAFQTSLLIEMTLLLLLSGLFYVFSQARATVENRDISLYYWAANRNDPMVQTVTGAVAKERADGTIQSAVSYHDYDSLRIICLFENETLTDAYRQTVRQADRSSAPQNWMYVCCDCGENGQIVCCYLDFIDDGSFRKLAEMCGAECGSGDALFFNYGSAFLKGEADRPPVLRSAPGPQTLYLNPAEPDDRGYALDTACFGGDGFDAERFLYTVQSSFSRAEINVAGLINDPEALGSLGLPTQSGPMLVLSQKDEPLFADFLSDVLFVGTERIIAEEHVSLSGRLLEQVKQCGSYDIRNQKFGTGTQIFGLSMNHGGLGFYKQTDNAQVREDYLVFQRMFRSFYVYFFVLHGFMLLSNIVNIVYLNQRKRKREYAVLLSLGLSERQQRGMRLCESAIYSLRCAFFSFLCAAVLYIPGYLFLLKGMTWEGFSEPGPSLYELDVPQTVVYILQHALKISGISFGLVAVVSAAVFLLFLLAGVLTQRKLTDEKLITLLKDDMHE